MKNYILLLLMMMTAGMVSGQAKVYSTGKIVLGDNTGLTPIDELHVNGRARMTDGSVINSGASASIMFNREDKSAFIIGAGNDAGMSWDGAFNFELRSNLRSRITVNRYIQNGTVRFKILGSNGNVGIGRSTPIEKLDVNGSIRYNGSNYNASDKRLKSNINEFAYGLKEVVELHPVTYAYNGEAGIEGKQTHVGLLAQELQDVAPSLVSSFDYVEYADEEETIVKSKKDYLQINETAIKYMLVNAIKEQQTVIEEMKSQINYLNDAIASLVDASKFEDDVNLSLGEKSSIAQNQPNPYNGSTIIEYAIEEINTTASINFYSFSGQLIKSVDVSKQGTGQLNVSAQDLPTGSYTYNLVVDGKIVDTKKMVVAK